MSDHTISQDSATLAKGQQVFTACGFLHHNFEGVEKVFVAKRAETKKFLPGVFELPGGHIDFGEGLVEGLKREVQEELHKEIAVGDPLAVFTYMNELKGSHSIEVIYFAQFVGGIDDIRLNVEDHSAYGWLAEDELDKLVEDDETQAMRRGFAFLRGESLKFA